jgi:hypothetical protein
MVSPGTGAGSQAMALGQLDGVIETLFKIAGAFEPGSPELTGILGATKLLNNLKRKKPDTGASAAPPAPPIPAVQPGSVGIPKGPLPPGGEQPGMPMPGGSE